VAFTFALPPPPPPQPAFVIEPIVADGRGFNVITIVWVFIQPLEFVPVAVYVVVTVGLAVMVAPVVALRFVLGVQV